MKRLLLPIALLALLAAPAFAQEPDGSEDIPSVTSGNGSGFEDTRGRRGRGGRGDDRPVAPDRRLHLVGRIGRHALRWSPTVGRQRHAPQVEPSGTIGGDDD